MKLTKNIEAIDLALYLKKENALVISDLHLGYEKALHSRGILVPRFQFKEIKERLEKIFNTCAERMLCKHLSLTLEMAQSAKLHQFKYIIINGDLKHEFGRISEQEWNEVLELIDLLEKHCEKIVIIKGQHDIFLNGIAKKKNIELVESFCKNKIFITHGHKIPEAKKFEKAEIVIIGNEHPAISLTDGIITEKYKCFLKGKFKNKILIVQPSFCIATEGIDILKEQVISEFLRKVNLKNFEAFVAAPNFNEIKYFGKIKNLQK